MILTTSHLPRLPIKGCLGLFLLLSCFIRDVSLGRECVSVCESPEGALECKASIDIASSLSSQYAKPAVLVMYRSTPLVLEATLQLSAKCFDSYDVRWAWSVSNDRGVRLKLDDVARGTTTPILQLPPNVLDVGDYVFRVNAALTKPTECISLKPFQDHLEVSAEIPIKVNMSKLIVVLSGASERRVHKHGVFTLNASLTHDPDGQTKLSNILFAYTCDSMGNYLNVTREYEAIMTTSKIDVPAVTTTADTNSEFNHSLASVSVPAMTTISDRDSELNYSLASVSVPALTTISDRDSEFNHSLASFSVPALTTITDGDSESTLGDLLPNHTVQGQTIDEINVTRVKRAVTELTTADFISDFTASASASDQSDFLMTTGSPSNQSGSIINRDGTGSPSNESDILTTLMPTGSPSNQSGIITDLRTVGPPSNRSDIFTTPSGRNLSDSQSLTTVRLGTIDNKRNRTSTEIVKEATRSPDGESEDNLDMSLVGMAPPTSSSSLCRGLHRPFRYTNNSFITLQAKDFPPIDKYIFRVYAIVQDGKFQQKSCEEQIIAFVNYDPGAYEIVCHHNCNPSLSLGHKIVLKAECSVCLDAGFEWRIEAVDDKNFKKKVAVKWGIDTEFGKNHKHLTLYPGALGSYKGIENVRFSLYGVKGGALVSKVIPVTKKARLKGKCEIRPIEGWELITEFTINCTNLFNVSGTNWQNILYFEYGQKVKSMPDKKSKNIILRYSSSPLAYKIRLLAGDPKLNYKTQLWITIMEKLGLSTSIPLNVVVRPTCINGACSSTKPDCLTKLINDSKGGSNYFANLQRMGKQQNAIATAHVIIHMMNRDGGQIKPANHLAKIRDGLLTSAGGCTNSVLPAIKQALYFVSSVFHTDDVSEILYETQLHGMTTLKNCVEMLERLPWETKEFQEVEIKHLARDSCGTLSNIFESFHSGQTVQSPSKMTIPLNHLESILQSVTNTLLSYVKINDLWKVVFTDYFNLVIQKVKMDYLIGTKFGYIRNASEIKQLGYFRIPPNVREDEELASQNVSVQLIQFKRNPLKLGAPKSSNLHAIPLFFYIRNLVTNKLITDELGPVDVHLATPGDANSATQFQYFGIVVRKATFEDSDIGLHRTYLSPSNELHTVMLAVSLLSPSHSVQAILKERVEPRIKDFSNASAVTILTADDLSTENREDITFINISLSKRSILFAGFLPSKATAENLIKEFANVTKKPVLLYAPTMRIVNCLHFDKRKDQWSAEDCLVVTDGSTSMNQLHCRCTSLSRFSGQSESVSAVAGQTNDQFEFYLNVPFNLVIVIFILVLAIIFALLFLLATYMDSLLSYKLGVTVVEDNDPEFTYGYLVSVSTCTGSGSGTTSVAAIQLHGEDGMSNTHVLVDKKRHLMRTASTDHFLITTQNVIHGIHALTLVQKAVAPTPAWNLLRIVVADLVSEGVWEFYINQELECNSSAPIKRNFEGKAVPEGDQDKIVSTSERIKKRFADDFIWTSVFLRPPCSPFTSIQRAICVILLIQLAILINLLLRGLPEHTPTQHIGVHGFRVFISDILLGLITAAILLVCVFVIVYVLKTFFSKLTWKVYIDLSNDWNEFSCRAPKVPVKVEDKRKLVKGEGASKVEESKKSGPLRPPENYLLKLANSKEFEINMSAIVKEEPTTSIRPVSDQPSPGTVKTATDNDSATDSSDTEREAPMKTGKKRSWYCHGRGCVWIFLAIVILVLFVLLYCLGHWFSETQTLLWIFSSAVSLLICIFLLQPLVLLVIAIFCPLKNTLDKDSLLKVGLSNILDQRQRLIREKGTLGQFRQYLMFLRQQPIYYTNDERSKKATKVSAKT